MQVPTSEELRRIAKFDVGNKVYLYGSLKWVVTRRYWSKSEGRILYDILFERTGVTSERKTEEELSNAN